MNNIIFQTAIMLATSCSRVRHITSLLANSADPFVVDKYGNNCFHMAARAKDNGCMKALCKWFSQTGEEKSKLDSINYEGELFFPLIHCFLHDSLYVLRMTYTCLDHFQMVI